jgi:hypothetical protein
VYKGTVTGVGTGDRKGCYRIRSDNAANPNYEGDWSCTLRQLGRLFLLDKSGQRVRDVNAPDADGGRQAAAQAQDVVIAVYEEPRHRVVFKNALVRVLDIFVPPGDTSRYHVHANPLVSVTVQDASSWSQTLGKAPGTVRPPRAVPRVSDDWDEPLPYTHRVANVDSVPYHRIAAEWLGPAGLDCPPLAPMDGYQLVKDGRFGRVYKVELGPHAATPPHVHACPGLTVVGTPGALLRTEGTAPAARGGTGAGSWYWRDAGHKHVIHNEGATVVVLYEIDWR